MSSVIKFRFFNFQDNNGAIPTNPFSLASLIINGLEPINTNSYWARVICVRPHFLAHGLMMLLKKF